MAEARDAKKPNKKLKERELGTHAEHRAVPAALIKVQLSHAHEVGATLKPSDPEEDTCAAFDLLCS